MTPAVAFWIGVGALVAAAVLYAVILPHVEGPSLDEQLPDHKEWLTRCPHCGRWQTLTPFSITEEEAGTVNWYRCRHCGRKWSEP